MSLSSSLGVSLSGLRNSQTALQITSGNIANADTPGYSRKSHNQSAAIGDQGTFGVRIERATRDLNVMVQRQWQNSKGDKAYSEVMQNYLGRIDTSFGQPGSAISLDTMFNSVLGSLESLATTPESYAAQLDVLNRSDEFASQLRELSAGIQAMRLEAEQAINTAVGDVNDALDLVRTLNQTIVEYGANGPPPDLLDQRDSAIDIISENMDIRVLHGPNNSVQISTLSGLSLFDVQEVNLVFDERSAMSASATWTNDPATSGVGSLLIRGINGADTNIFDGNYLRSGKIAALQELRDDQLVEAQRQLDELASIVALAASSVTQEGQAVTVGPNSGFDLDLTGWQAGNAITMTVDNAGTPQTYSFVAVTDAGLLPLPPEATANTNDIVTGIDISGGLAGAIAAITGALPGGYAGSSPAANTLRVLATGANPVTNLDADITRTGLTDEGLGLPMFVDSGLQLPYTNALENGGQLAGFAGRIQLNQSLRSDPSRLVVYDTLTNPTAAGDPIRANTMLQRFTATTFDLAPDTGLGTPTRNYSGTVNGVIGQLLSFQGSQSAEANRLKEAEDIRYLAIEQRLTESADVDIDTEMATLIELQNSYSANARVMSVVQEMMDELLRIL